jgi:hypothetical protein
MYDWLVWFMVFDATFNTILAILWQSVFMIGWFGLWCLMPLSILF